eukprot:scaffold14519_cov135-Isochrysis_galbana.AAC.1
MGIQRACYCNIRKKIALLLYTAIPGARAVLYKKHSDAQQYPCGSSRAGVLPDRRSSSAPFFCSGGDAWPSSNIALMRSCLRLATTSRPAASCAAYPRRVRCDCATGVPAADEEPEGDGGETCVCRHAPLQAAPSASPPSTPRRMALAREWARRNWVSSAAAFSAHRAACSASHS